MSGVLVRRGVGSHGQVHPQEGLWEDGIQLSLASEFLEASRAVWDFSFLRLQEALRLYFWVFAQERE